MAFLIFEGYESRVSKKANSKISPLPLNIHRGTVFPLDFERDLFQLDRY